MSDTSEAPSLASHVRRVRVPSQASDVDQFLDELFSPVLDGSLDELSDARSLSASIRGEKANFTEAPIVIDDDLNELTSVECVWRSIKGGGRGGGSDKDNDAKASNLSTSTLDREVEDINNPMEVSLDEYITGELNSTANFVCIFFNSFFMFFIRRFISTDFRKRFAETFDGEIGIGRRNQRRWHHASAKHIEWLRRIAADGRFDARKLFARPECTSRRRSDALSTTHAACLLAIGDGSEFANSTAVAGPKSGTENASESTGDFTESHAITIFALERIEISAQVELQRSCHIATIRRQRTQSQGIVGQQQFTYSTASAATDAATIGIPRSVRHTSVPRSVWTRKNRSHRQMALATTTGRHPNRSRREFHAFQNASKSTEKYATSTRRQNGTFYRSICRNLRATAAPFSE